MVAAGGRGSDPTYVTVPGRQLSQGSGASPFWSLVGFVVCYVLWGGGEGCTTDPKESPVALSSAFLLSLIPHSSTDHRALKFTSTVGLGM